MSFSGLPSYAETSVIPSIENGTPAYTAEPQPHEQRIGQNGLLTRLSGEFVKQTKNGAVTLRLLSQKRDARLPTYGLAGQVLEGTVIVSKPEGITSVDVKVCF